MVSAAFLFVSAKAEVLDEVNIALLLNSGTEQRFLAVRIITCDTRFNDVHELSHFFEIPGMVYYFWTRPKSQRLLTTWDCRVDSCPATD